MNISGCDDNKIKSRSAVSIFLFTVVFLFGVCVDVIDFDSQCFYLLALSELHFAHKIRNDKVDDRIGENLLPELVDLAMGGHHSE